MLLLGAEESELEGDDEFGSGGSGEEGANGVGGSEDEPGDWDDEEEEAGLNGAGRALSCTVLRLLPR